MGRPARLQSPLASAGASWPGRQGCALDEAAAEQCLVGVESQAGAAADFRRQLGDDARLALIEMRRPDGTVKDVEDLSRLFADDDPDGATFDQRFDLARLP